MERDCSIPLVERVIEKAVPELWWGWIRNPVDRSIFLEQAWDSNLRFSTS